MNKKMTLKTYVTIVLFSVFAVSTALSQTTIMLADYAKKKDLMAGFDEKATLAEFKQKGYDPKTFEERMTGAKYDYRMKSMGVEVKRSFSYHLPTTGPCDNAGFGDTTFNNWTGATGSVPGTVWTPGIVTLGVNTVPHSTSRHTIITNTTGFDPYAINPTTLLPEIPLTAPGGGGVSARLGTEFVGAQTEKLDYLIHVNLTNTSFAYQYAVLLENPTGHTAAEQPRFDIRVLDSVGTVIVGPCGVYGIDGSFVASDPTFHPWLTYTDDIGALDHDGYYKRWTTVGIDLTPYIGHPVTLEFQTSDCTLSGHFGYAYIDATCSQLQASIAFCPLDTNLLLVAPGGFSLYQWYDNTGVAIPAGLGGTNDSLWLSNPIVGQTYTVSMQSLAGCGSTLAVTLEHTNLTVANGFLNEVCFGDTTGLAYVTTTGAPPPIIYNWYNIAAPTTIISTNDSIINMPAGTYYCHVFTTGGCVGYDTVTISEPSLVADTSGTHTLFCPLDTNITLTAIIGMMQYQWYGPGGLITGETSASLVVPSPVVNQVYYCNMRPPTGCPTTFSDTLLYFNMNSNANVVPIGAFNISCYGFNDGTAYVSSASGAPAPFSYSWVSAGGGSIISTNDSLLNAFAGTYIVTVTSQGGCHTMDTVNLTQPFNPGDSVHLTTTFCQEDKNIVLRVTVVDSLDTYIWYFGNSDTTGIVLGTSDTLLIPDPVAGSNYTVLVTPPSGSGCPYLITSALNYAPPPNLPDYLVSSNAFSPDGNNINDKFDVSLSPTTHKTFAYTKDFHVEIYNRWGKKVFESDDVNNQWDGKINGNAADEGVYYWMAKFTSLCTPNGETHESTGFVQIFRKP